MYFIFFDCTGSKRSAKFLSSTDTKHRWILQVDFKASRCRFTCISTKTLLILELCKQYLPGRYLLRPLCTYSQGLLSSLELMPLLLQCMFFSLWMPFPLIFSQTWCQPISRVASGAFYKPPCSHVILPLPADWITTKCYESQLAGALSWESLVLVTPRQQTGLLSQFSRYFEKSALLREVTGNQICK